MDCSAVSIYSTYYIEKPHTPSSPPSSLRGVFSRSRPVSYAPSECRPITRECHTIPYSASDSSNHPSDVSTPGMNTPDDALSKSLQTLQDKRPQVSTEYETYEGRNKPKANLVGSEVKASNTTLLPHTVYTFLPGKARTSKEKTQRVPNEMGGKGPTDSPRSGHSSLTPSRSKELGWGAIRRTVSYIIHRDSKKEIGKDISLPSSARAAPLIISSPRLLKPSKSASIRSKSSSTSISIQHAYRSIRPLTISPPPRVFAAQQAQALARKQRLRRSRSVSGYPNVAAAIVDECSDVDMDAELDEATVEAQEVMEDIQRNWAFARMEEVDTEGGT